MIMEEPLTKVCESLLIKPLKKEVLIKELMNYLPHIMCEGIQNFPQSLNILLAEDSPTNALVARKFLEIMGHRTVIITNGSQSITILKNILSLRRNYCNNR